MHIGLVIYGTLDHHSGGFLYDRQIVGALEGMGDRVSIFSIAWHSYPRSLADNLDVALGNHLAEGDWDVLVQDELAHPALIRPNRRVHDLQGPPVVSLVHLLHCESRAWPWWKGWLYRLVERRYLRGVDGCIYVSRRNQALAEALIGSSKPSVIAYPAGDHLSPAIDMAAILARVQRSGPLEIGYLGNVIPRKALHVLLQALAEIPEVNWRLRVIGSLEADRVYAARIQHQAAAPPLAGRVEFTGELDHPEVGRILADCDVMALPSESEGYAIAYLEALGHGLPVIATAASGAVELVQHGENGFLVQPNDPAGIREALALLASDPLKRQQMSVAARRSYEKHPTWKDSANTIRSFLAERIAAHEQAAQNRMGFFSIPL
jgi:glycosyltransferase involved in cell wall biosynthesis